MKRTLLFSLLFLTPYLNFSQCSNLTDGGQIGYDEVSCGPFDPAPIQNLQTPSGGSGTIEYMWIKTYDPNNYGMADAIPGANGITYDPPYITQTTWFVRCARRSGCTQWVGEDIVYKHIVNISVTATASPLGCDDLGGIIDFDVDGGSSPITYYVDGNIHSWGNQYSAGQHIVSVVDANGCTAYDTIIIEMTDFNISIDILDEPCSFVNDFAMVNATGGTPPYTYAWSDGSSSALLQDQNLGLQGTYAVTVTDQEGCSLSEIVQFDVGGPASAEIGCCADTVICLGSTAYITVEIEGYGPWTLTYLVDGNTQTDTVTQIPYYIELTPASTTIIELVSIEGSCGIEQACGQATIAVNDCDPLSCLNGCFFSNVYENYELNGCTYYTMYLTANGCQTELSNATISIPCGNVTQMWNDEGFPMSVITNPDPNTGITGIKIDNISGIGPNDSFEVTFAVCEDECDQVLNCTPLVAFKAGPCVYYAQSASYNQTFNINWNETKIESWPNPFNDQCFIKISEGDFQQYMGMGQLLIVDINGVTVKTFDFQAIPVGGMTLMWDGITDQGREADRGVYFINYRTSDMYGNRVDRNAGIRIIKQ